MKIRFLNHTISIIQNDRALPYPYYDINYAYKNVIVSNHVNITDNVDNEQLNEIILKGCIDIAQHYSMGLNNNTNPVYDYIISKVNILGDVYEIEDNKKIFKYRGKK